MKPAAAALLLLLSVGSPSGAGEPPRNESARRELRQILSRPEFRDARPGQKRIEKDFDPPRWMQRWTDFVNGVQRRIREALFPPRTPGEPDSPHETLFSRASLPGVVAAIAALTAAVLLILLRRRRRGSRASIPSVELPAIAADDARLRDAAGWEREAEQLLAAGRFREAVRARYLGTLSFLSARGAIRYERFKTNWEYARDLARTAEEFRPGFERLTNDFDYGWYGLKSLDARAAEEFFASEANWRRRFRN